MASPTFRKPFFNKSFKTSNYKKTLFSVINLSDIDPVKSSDTKIIEPLGSHPIKHFNVFEDL